MIPYNKKLVGNARSLRKNMTPEERHIWYDFLKRLPLTVRRQHNIGDFIVDFYIPEKKLVIEIDGRQHALSEHAQSDRERDAALSKWGIVVLRYSNDEIRNCFDMVEKDILKKVGLELTDLSSV